MGQIINRIKRIVDAERNAKDEPVRYDLLEDDDEELKRVIDSLKKNKEQTKHSSDNDEFDKNSKLKLDLDSSLRILGLYHDATNEMIKSTYYQRIKEYHPDKVAQLGEELRELAEKKTQEINEAYNFLRKLKGF